MKKALKLFLFVGLMCTGSVANCQTTTDKSINVFNVFEKVGDLFDSWITGISKIGDKQTQKKFVVVCDDIYKNLDKILIVKERLRYKLKENTVTAAEWNNAIFDITKGIKRVNELLEKSDELTASTGLPSYRTKLAGKLDSDINQKELMFEDIVTNNKQGKKDIVMKKLDAAIEQLTAAKDKIDKFTEALNKKAQ